MSEQITYEDCIEYFEYFYSKVSGQQGYVFEPRSQEKSCIQSFVFRTRDLFGYQSLFNYLCFGFSKYEGLSTSQGRNNIKSMWVFGNKVFQEYCNRDHEKSAYWVEIMKKNYQIRESDLIQKEACSVDLSTLDSFERKRFTDKDRQLIHCIENNLYRELNATCILCSKNSICKKID